MTEPYYADESVTIYHGDCRDILPSLPKVDLVRTDPPYGIAYSSQRMNYPNATRFGNITGDEGAELAEWAIAQFSQPTTLVLWGANNFPWLLPYGGVWLCWDKRVVERADRIFGWPIELAWVNRKKGKAHIYRIQHGGVVNADGKNTPRYHPTQKPVTLFSRVLQDYEGEPVLDPFMGSGTALVAALKLGRKAIGIELEERYCEIAANRCRQMVMQWEQQ
jgi:DNA modification methylase